MISQASAAGQPASAIVVTGASSGIGLELSRQLAAADRTVIAIARDAGRLDALARQSPRILAEPFDLAETGKIDALVARLLAQHPAIDAIVNNAAIQNDVRFDDPRYGCADIATEIAINLTAPMALTRALLPHLATRPRAAILTVTSGLGFVPKRTAAVYSATKAGMHLFSEALRVQMRGTSVRVIEAVMPLVDTAMTAGRGAGKISAADAAAAVAAALQADAGCVHVGKARALPALLRIAPWLAARIMQRD